MAVEFKVGDRIKRSRDYDEADFDYDTVYTIEDIKSGYSKLKIKGKSGYWMEHKFYKVNVNPKLEVPWL